MNLPKGPHLSIHTSARISLRWFMIFGDDSGDYDKEIKKKQPQGLSSAYTTPHGGMPSGVVRAIILSPCSHTSWCRLYHHPQSHPAFVTDGPIFHYSPQLCGFQASILALSFLQEENHTASCACAIPARCSWHLSGLSGDGWHPCRHPWSHLLLLLVHSLSTCL